MEHGSSNTRRDPLQPSWNHPFVTFNNQDSVLMSMSLPIYDIICLLHDNRIFAFERNEESDDSSSTSNEQNVILNLLTTPKYRAMSFMYIIFLFLDNINFLVIIVLSITGADPLTCGQVAIFSAIGLELFYDVMLYTHKYWILHRLSVYIGLMLYCLYYVIILCNGYEGDKYFVVLTVLGLRFLAFILEECVDIAIDVELHNDLLRLQNIMREQDEEMGEDECQPLLGADFTSLLSKSKFTSYMDVSLTVKMPKDVVYKGSFFAWAPKSVFTHDVWTKEKFPRSVTYTLCFIQFFMATFLFLFLVITLCFVSLIPVLIAYIFAAISERTNNMRILNERVTSSAKSFWKELTHF